MGKQAAAPGGRRRPRRRCAIYTRKSSEEGLEQDFNSLDAQREACEAFIRSQRQEGWSVLPDLYNDGGVSGASMQRPALQRLLGDIEQGRIDVVVVYKVDRLTRSLADFAKIVEIFDQKAVSFVSVTQAFNTTTSMGRLTLNVLLSFAQFEREVTGERIRDKIAASKKKGLWMGGHVALGYDVKDRKLMVNEAEAATVRYIFGRYSELKSVRHLQQELAATGVVSKARTASDGSPYGAKPLIRGALYALLQNPIYRGQIAHKGAVYPGAHAAIISEDLWQAVQATLAHNRVKRGAKSPAEPSLLAGLICDAAGQPMTPTHANKKGKRYRYYVSRHLITEGTARRGKGQRVPAASLEALAIDRIRTFLADSPAVLEAIKGRIADGSQQKEILTAAARLAETWAAEPPEDLRQRLRVLIERVQVHTDRVEIAIRSAGLVRLTAIEDDPSGAIEAQDDSTVLTLPARLRRAGTAMRLVLENGSRPAAVDPGLIRLLVRAHVLWERLRADPSLAIGQLAREQQMGDSYATRLMRLTFLAPDIVDRILCGRQPHELTVRRLMEDTRLPLDWAEQRRQLGFV